MFGKIKLKKQKTLLLCLAAVLVIGVGCVVAFITTNTDSVSNEFSPAQVTCEVDEKLNGATKSDVSIKNTGDVSAFIRATVVITWQDEDGNVLGQDVADNDYTLEYTDDSKWVKGADGYYYFKEAVAEGNSTTVLIDECRQLKDCEMTGYSLSVEILAEAIQADGVNGDGTKAVVDAWGVDPTKL